MAVIDNLVEYYSLEEASGDAIGAHASKTATETGGTIASTTGKVGNARDLERGDLAIFRRADTALRFTGDFSVSVWIKPEALLGANGTYGGGVAAYMTPDTAGDWWIAAQDQGRIFFAHFATSGANATGKRFTETGKVSDGVWAHIVARHASGVFTVWLDNVSQSLTEASTDSGWSAIGFNIGMTYTSADYCFDGLVDELGIWGRAISDADIAWLYNTGNGRTYADIVAEASGGGQPTRRRWGGVPHLGGQGIGNKGGGRMWGRSTGGLVVPKRYADDYAYDRPGR